MPGSGPAPELFAPVHSRIFLAQYMRRNPCILPGSCPPPPERRRLLLSKTLKNLASGGRIPVTTTAQNRRTARPRSPTGVRELELRGVPEVVARLRALHLRAAELHRPGMAARTPRACDDG
eukprot:COSAG01_NODE_4389_length_5071_cov_139.047246_6_plen_121_part_00